MSTRREMTAAERYRVVVDKLVGDCTRAKTTYEAAAAAHPPTVALLAYMRLFDVGQTKLAKQLDTTQTNVSLLLNGKLVPDMQLRKAIRDVCSIPVANWDRPWRAASA